MNGVWTMLCAKSFLQRACIKAATRTVKYFLAAKVFPNDFKLSFDLLRKSASMDVQLFTDCAWTQLDTIFLVKQDTARMKLQGVINGP